MEERTLGKALMISYCGRQDCEKGHAFGPAVRTQYLLHYILSGKGVYEVGGRRFALSAGQGFLIKPGELTYYKADDDSPWRYMWVAFDGYEARRLLARCGIDYTMTARDPAAFERQLTCLTEIFGTAGHNEYAYLALFYGMMSAQVQPEQEVPGSFAGLYTEKAADYMQDNFSYPITVQDVAAYVGIDRTYLYKLFTGARGLSPKQFLLNIRVNAAKAMLLENRYTLTQIALSCGFGDAPALCAQFKKTTGKTPKEFKAELTENNRN